MQCAIGTKNSETTVCYTTCHMVNSTVHWRVLRRKDKSPSTMDSTSESGCPWSHLRGCCHNPLTFQCLHFSLQRVIQCLKLLVSKGKLLLFRCDPFVGGLQWLGRRWSHNMYAYANSSQKGKCVYCCTSQGTWHTSLHWRTWHYSNHNCIFKLTSKCLLILWLSSLNASMLSAASAWPFASIAFTTFVSSVAWLAAADLFDSASWYRSL